MSVAIFECSSCGKPLERASERAILRTPSEFGYQCKWVCKGCLPPLPLRVQAPRIGDPVRPALPNAPSRTRRWPAGLVRDFRLVLARA